MKGFLKKNFNAPVQTTMYYQNYAMIALSDAEMNLFQAVQEFSELCKASTEEDVLNVLPFWPRIYNRLAIVSVTYLKDFIV